jgi:hypothetical protein
MNAHARWAAPCATDVVIVGTRDSDAAVSSTQYQLEKLWLANTASTQPFTNSGVDFAISPRQTLWPSNHTGVPRAWRPRGVRRLANSAKYVLGSHELGPLTSRPATHVRESDTEVPQEAGRRKGVLAARRVKTCSREHRRPPLHIDIGYADR